MIKPRFIYEITTDKSFNETAVSLIRCVEKKSWTVFHIYDIKERLASKGYNNTPLKILEIWKENFANSLININIHASLCMPCRINIIEKDGKVSIITMLPSVLLPSVTSFLFNGMDSNTVEQIEEDLKDIIHCVKKN